MVIRRMKPLGFTLAQMRDLLDAGEREALLERVRAYRQAAAEQVEKLRVQLARAEDFAAALGARLEQDAPPAHVEKRAMGDENQGDHTALQVRAM